MNRSSESSCRVLDWPTTTSIASALAPPCISSIARHSSPYLCAPPTVQTFVSNGTVQYIGTAFIGYVGLLTGMRPNVFSVSVDERDQGGNVTGLIENFMSALQVRR